MRWHDAFRRFLVEAESRLTPVLDTFRQVEDPILIPYRGFGTSDRLWIRGRAIDDPRIAPSQDAGTLAGNIRDVWMRFASHEIPGAKLELRVGEKRTVLTTGPEGYFETWFQVSEDQASGGWLPYDVRLVEPAPRESGTSWEGEVLVPREDAAYGIISDVDDTVIESSATSRLRMLRTLLTGNARTRLPFDGIAPLLSDLQDGGNPIFYVSSGPWNLYDFLEEFFQINGLPAGPILLQDYGLDERKLIHAPHHEHKLEQIGRVMTTYPHLNWILIGDSGQRDPEIYAALASELEDKIAAIVIRDVTTAARDEQVRALLAPAANAGIPVALVESAEDARTFFVEHGYLTPLQRRKSAS